MASLFLYRERDSKPEGARSVKQNSLNNCFVAEWCDGGYCEHCGAVAEQCGISETKFRQFSVHFLYLRPWEFILQNENWTLREQKAHKKVAGGKFFSFLMRSPVPKGVAFGWTSRTDAKHMCPFARISKLHRTLRTIPGCSQTAKNHLKPVRWFL